MFCKQCGYDLRETLEPRCPECGSEFRRDDSNTFDDKRPGRVMMAGRRFGGRVWIAVTVLLAVVALQTAIRIELCNLSVGGYLPRKDMGGGGNDRWTHAIWDNEARWRQMLGPKNEDGSPVSRALTEEEEEAMESEIREAINWNRLLDLVAGWGLLQYPVVFFLVISSVVTLVGSKGAARRSVGAIGLVVAIGGGVLMFYREYFVSLGW